MTDEELWAQYRSKADDRRDARKKPKRAGPPRLVFYGRCSTNDMQDPVSSRLWQRGNAEQVAARIGGVITGEFFDEGNTRALPLTIREAAREMLEILRPTADGDRVYDGVVVGELQRVFHGQQFQDTYPLLESYGVFLASSEFANDVYDPKNANDRMVVTMKGMFSENERETTKSRVRAGMAEQVKHQGRYQGGRAPYGYRVEPYDRHPNPRKSAEGYRLKRLAIDPETAPIVRLIFERYLSGVSLRGIATLLNNQGVPCPSRKDPLANMHRIGTAWQVGTISVIISNPRYTGYEFWGRTMKVEVPIDPLNRSKGFRTRLIPSDRPQVQSLELAHAPIVSVEAFMAAQDIQERRGPRSQKHRKACHPLHGHVVCGECGRNMHVERYNHGKDDPDRSVFVRFRCRGGAAGPGSPAAHPQFNALQRGVTAAVEEWFATLFDADNRSETLTTLLTSATTASDGTTVAAIERRIAGIEASLARLAEAISDGVSHDAVRKKMSENETELRSLRAEKASMRNAAKTPAAGDLSVRVDRLLADGGLLQNAPYDLLEQLYAVIGLEVLCVPLRKEPRGNSQAMAMRYIVTARAGESRLDQFGLTSVASAEAFVATEPTCEDDPNEAAGGGV